MYNTLKEVLNIKVSIYACPVQLHVLSFLQSFKWGTGIQTKHFDLGA